MVLEAGRGYGAGRGGLSLGALSRGPCMSRGYEDHREAMVRMACQDGEMESVVQVKMEYHALEAIYHVVIPKCTLL